MQTEPASQLPSATDGGRLSPRDIVQRRTENAWDLALVQRDQVWKEDRIRLLLDSLIMGYPVGALLFCQIERPGSASIPFGAGQAGVRESDSVGPQLVDGQQRVFAIFSLFTGQGYGRFYLNLYRDPSRDAGYILWRRFDPDLDVNAEGFDERFAEPIVNRDRYVDLSNWAGLDGLLDHEIDESRIGEVITRLDRKFRLPSGDLALHAVARLETLRAAWRRASIPMITAAVRDPEDVLEVFNRVNRGGAPVSSNDLYFAAVKTFWHDPDVSRPGEPSAHEALKGISDATGGLLDVYGALSLLSRLALAGIGLSDMVPVNVDRLGKANKAAILRSMKSIVPTVTQSAARFTAAHRSSSRLGFALSMTRRQVWEEVFAWVVASAPDREWLDSDIADVEEYVLGTTLFGHQQVLGDGFRRDAFAVAVAAGEGSERFPKTHIIGTAHGRAPRLKRGRQQVRGLTDPDERIALARSAPGLLVAVAQGLPSDIGVVDWDHIVAAANQRRFRLPRGLGRRYAEEHVYLNWPGNFWYLDASANRSVKDMSTREKFTRLREWASSDPNGKGRIGPDSSSGIVAAHLAAFEALGDELQALDYVPAEDRVPRLQQVALSLAQLLRERTMWLLDETLSRFPGVAAFASDVDTAVRDVPRLPAGLSDRLGIDTLLRSYGLDAVSVEMAKKRKIENIYARRGRLQEAIAERLDEPLGIEEQWVWPSRRGEDPKSCVAFVLRGGNTIELVIDWTPDFGDRLRVKAYAKRESTRYSDFDDVPLGEGWDATDAEIAEAFMRHAIELQIAHPR